MNVIIPVGSKHGSTRGIAEPTAAVIPVAPVSFRNGCVSALLRSPLHRLMSGSTDLVRYQGRESGRTFTMPTQYVERGDEVVIMVGRPEAKTWWHNFRTDRDLDLLIRGRWSRMNHGPRVLPGRHATR